MFQPISPRAPKVSRPSLHWDDLGKRPWEAGEGARGPGILFVFKPKRIKKKKNLETDTCLCVYMCVPCTHDSSKKQFILHPPFVSLGKIRTPAPPGPLPPSSRRCRKQGPLEVQTLITELEYFSKLQGMAPGDKRKQEESAEEGGESQSAQGCGGGSGGWDAGGPLPPGRAPYPQPVRPGAPCRQRWNKAIGCAAGAPWGRDAGLSFLALSRV